jgi:UTP--glucose-1-phosphate uridylyltransferase
MLPIVDKPLIQYAVEEAIAAGAEKLVFITGATKRAIEDHFDVDADLERALAESNKTDMLRLVRDIVPSNVSCVYVRQGNPLGLGHAVLCAQSVVGNEPFFVHLADDLIYSDVPVLKQMSQQYEQHGVSVLGVQPVPHDQTGSYGIVAVDRQPSGADLITQIVEKPAPADAPSNLGVVGRYILTPKIFEILAATGRGAGGEIQLTDGIAELLTVEGAHAYTFAGERYDCGSKIGYLRATVEYALRHSELGDSFRAYLQSVWER